MRLVTFLILIISLSAHAEITERGRGMLFGSDHVFTVQAKQGWVLDNESGVQYGLHMLFYPLGGTGAKNPVMVYGRSIPISEAPSIEKRVGTIINDFKTNGSPNIKSVHKPSFVTHHGKNAELFYFSGDQWGNYEASTYFKEEDTINYLVFSSKNKQLFDKYINNFIEMAKTYKNNYKSPNSLPESKIDNLKAESASDLSIQKGKDYEVEAIIKIKPALSNTMRMCFTHLGDEKFPAFNYLVRINNEGSIADSYVYPTHALSNCFKGLMSYETYPKHSFKSFILNINMNFSP